MFMSWGMRVWTGVSGTLTPVPSILGSVIEGSAFLLKPFFDPSWEEGKAVD